MTDADMCVCCGEYVPEGRQVCRSCSEKNGVNEMTDEEREMIAWLSQASEESVRRQMRRVEKKLFGGALV